MTRTQTLRLAAAVCAAMAVPAVALATPLEGLDGPNNGQSSEHRQDDFVNVCHHTDEHSAHEWVTVQVDGDAWAEHTSAHSSHELDFLVTEGTPCPPLVVEPTPEPTETPTDEPTVPVVTTPPTLPPGDNPVIAPPVEVSNQALTRQATAFNPDGVSAAQAEVAAPADQLPFTGAREDLMAATAAALMGAGLFFVRRTRA